MNFQVEFALPYGQFLSVFAQTVEEGIGTAENDFGTAGERFLPQVPFHIIFGRSAAAIADPVKAEEFGEESVFLEFVLRIIPSVGGRNGIVIAFRWEVCDDFGTVDPFPAECVMGEFIDLGPGEFLREEVIATCFFDDLGERGGIPENVRDPQVFHIDAEFIHEKVFRHEELSCHGFAGNDIAVGFHPHTALHFPAAFFDPVFDLGIESRIILLDHHVKFRLGCPENVFRVFLHQCDLTGESAPRFPDAFPYRPEPAHVDMSVSDTADIQRAGIRALAEDRFFEVKPCGGDIGGIIVVNIQSLCQCVKDLHGVIIFLRDDQKQTVKCLDIVEKTPHFTVEHAQLHIPDRGREGTVGLDRIFLVGQRLIDPEKSVRGGFHPAGNGFPGFFFSDHHAVFFVFVIHDTEPCQTVNGRTFFIEDQGFAAGIDAETEFFPREFRGYFRCEMEPGTLPFFSPDIAFGNGMIGQILPLCKGDGVIGDGNDSAEGNGAGVYFQFLSADEFFDAGEECVVNVLVHGIEIPLC